MSVTRWEFIARPQHGGAVQVSVRVKENRTVHNVGKLTLRPEEFEELHKIILQSGSDPMVRVDVVDLT